MPRLSEKYIAGFLDADGCIAFRFSPDCNRPQMAIQFSQKTQRDEVLKAIQEVAGGQIYTRTVKDKSYSVLTICGKPAKALLARIEKHLVLKRHQAAFALRVAGQPMESADSIKAENRATRRQSLDALPNFPSRKWLAGYFDGDGCVSVARLGTGGGANLVAHVAASDYDRDSLDLLQKAFGGRIHTMRQSCFQWVLALPPSKAKEFLGYFAKHSIVKRDQLHFILGCTEKVGHYRDGKSIKSALKHLKAQEQRLSDSEVAELVNTIQDLPRYKRTDYGQFVRDENGRITGKAA